MKTVGRHIPQRFRRRGVFTAKCDVCDNLFHSGQLRRMEDGTLLCFGQGTLNDAQGRVGLTLDRLNAQHAQRQTEPITTQVSGRGKDS
jgi:hypothetical protein